MKRKPSSIQLTTPLTSSKEVIRRLKSPQAKRIPTKKGQEGSSILLPKYKGTRSKEENKPDSNNTTASAKSKVIKTKKTKKNGFEGLQNEEIMHIINSFASRIQKQWRVYLFRKRWKEVYGKKTALRQEKSKQFSGLRFNNQKIFQLIQPLEEISSGSMLYDRQKYDSFSSYKESAHFEKEKEQISARSRSQKSLKTPKSSTPRYQDQPKSKNKIPKELPVLKEKLSRSVQKQFSEDEVNKEVRRASFHVVDEKKIMENRRHSTGQLPPKKIVSEKQFQIGKAYDIIIDKPEKKPLNIESPSCKKKIQSEAAIAFKKGSSIDKMMSKCKKQLQIGKLKQLLSVENRYSKNEVTYKNYLQIVGKINQEHTSKLQEIKAKEGNLKNALGELLQFYKGNRFAQDQIHNTSHLDVSLSFDKWDFNSSAKKSIDHFQFPEGNSSKVLSIESVLRELEEEESGAISDQKRFKKNKSLQMIEAIAERSKEISEKDVVSFQESPTQQKGDTQKETITIKQAEESKECAEDQIQIKLESDTDQQANSLRMTHPFQLENNSEQLQDKIDKTPENIKPSSEEIGSNKTVTKVQQNYSSQSLLITPAGTNPLISSQESIQPKGQHDFMRELIHKEIKTTTIDYEDSSIKKFRELVIEKILMTNIKFINSIKFVFAKAGDLRKQAKAITLPQLPYIETDIGAINTWLLQISHFALDSYFTMFRDNLEKVKQPPLGQIFAMARRQLTTNPPYETIPEFIYKDFQYCYIKKLQKDHEVEDKDYDVFSSLLYTFHRVLIDALNEALMEELFTGKDWIQTPWRMPKKFKAYRQNRDQVKLCLERSINVVSNWGQYGLGRLVLDDDFTPEEYKQFQEQKIKLVCRQQILSEMLNPTFVVGNFLLQLTDFIYQRQLKLALGEISQLFG